MIWWCNPTQVTLNGIIWYVIRDVPDSGSPVIASSTGNAISDQRPVPAGIMGADSNILQTAAVIGPRPAATQVASLCTYISSD